MARRRDYEEIGEFIGASAKTVEDMHGHHHPEYLKEATENLNIH